MGRLCIATRGTRESSRTPESPDRILLHARPPGNRRPAGVDEKRQGQEKTQGGVGDFEHAAQTFVTGVIQAPARKRQPGHGGQEQNGRGAPLARGPARGHVARQQGSDGQQTKTGGQSVEGPRGGFDPMALQPKGAFAPPPITRPQHDRPRNPRQRKDGVHQRPVDDREFGGVGTAAVFHGITRALKIANTRRAREGARRATLVRASAHRARGAATVTPRPPGTQRPRRT